MSTLEFDQIVTRTGDGGYSSSWDGDKFRKDDILFEVLGNIDELSSWIGVLKDKDASLEKIQAILHDIMALIATDPKFVLHDWSNPTSEKYLALKPITDTTILDLEKEIRYLMNSKAYKSLNMNAFILPSGFGHVVRAVCRRAERSLVHFMNGPSPRPDLKYCSRYLNRLSDYFFVYSITNVD